jgi:hypothetical protein
MQTRPTRTLPALAGAEFVEFEDVAAFDQHDFTDRAVHGCGETGVALEWR